MKKTIFFVILSILMIYGCTLDENENTSPTINDKVKSVSNSDCTGYPTKASTEQIITEILENGDMKITIKDAVFNCCLDKIEADVDITDYNITIDLTEVAPEPCHCVCNYDVDVVLQDLTIGTYTIKYGSVSKTVDYMVESNSIVKSVSNSDCLGDITKGDTTSITTEILPTGELKIIVHNAEFNCCLDKIDATVNLNGNDIDVQLSEVAPNPCYCICPYDVEIVLQNLSSGTYTIIYGSISETVTYSPVSNSIIKSVSNSDCLTDITKGDVVYITTEILQTGELKITVHNVEFNCCLNRINATAVLNNTDINIQLSEVVQTPCKCMCLYDVDIVFQNLMDGTYTINYGSISETINITTT